MKRPILNAHGAPLAPTEPVERTVDRPIVAVRMQDKEGAAEFTPQADITAMEAYQLANIMAWCVTQPPVQRDPRSGDVIHVNTMWRKYIADNALERHFTFSMSIPLREPGHA